jgi:TatD DNase family protein
MMALESMYEACILMMGLHPCSVKGNYKEELRIVEEWLDKRKFAAIGEIGLDFYWDKTFIDQQYEAFKLQMEWALKYELPIVIHSREAMRECIDTVKPFAKRGLRGIFHCFGDSLSLANEISGMGFYLGIGGVITYKKSGLAETIKDIPLEHIVLETDAPYLTPVPFRGKRNESSYLRYVVEKIAEVKGVSAEIVGEITSENALKVYGE